jgi:hypothetical protein
LIRFIVNGNHAFNIVEEPDFKQLIAGLSPEIQLPSHQTIQREISSEFEENKSKLKSQLSKIDNKIAITTDVWTSMSERPYTSITAHYVNTNKNLSHILLDFRYIPHPHSGEQIKKILIEVFQEFEIQDRIIAITSDNARNNISAIKLLNDYFEKEIVQRVIHFPCFAHVLNIAINEGIKQISGIISNLRIIAAKLKSSSKQTQKFEETSKVLEQPYVKLKRDIHIRWNSTFDMIERALKMRKVIDIMCIKDDDFKAIAIKDNEWEILSQICEFLRPFYESTKLLSGQKYSSICFVIPLLDHLLNHLDSVIDNESLKNCSQLIKIKLKDYELRLKNNCSYFAVIFDPRLNFLYLRNLLNKNDYENVEKEFKKEFDKYVTKYSQTTKSTDFTKASSSLLDSIYKKRKLNGNEEIVNYSQIPQENTEIDPIEWWKSHESLFPCLSKFAYDFLCITATSVPSEQVFSKAGIIITKRRNRLSDNSIRSIMCLNSFYNNLD